MFLRDSLENYHCLLLFWEQELGVHIKFGGNTKLGGLILLRMAYSSLEKSKITLLSQVIWTGQNLAVLNLNFNENTNTFCVLLQAQF